MNELTAPDLPKCPTCGQPLGAGSFCTACLLAAAAARWSEAGKSSSRETHEGSVAGLLRFQLPEAFGDYRIGERLGEGGMGVVCRAWKVSLKKDVAIKFIKAGAAASARQRALFLREAELASKLDHPNIATVSEVGEHDGIPYLVMRFIDGVALSERLAEPGFCPDLRSRVRLLLEIATAVHHAHQRGVIHLDLKPGNVLVDAAGTPFVGDFGLARWIEQESTVTYGEGALIGTPAFMSPEQAAGRREDLTIATDVWSLGVILHLMISGRLPFEANALAGVVHRILHEEPPPPFVFLVDSRAAGSATAIPRVADAASVPGHARRDLAGICGRCLEKEPARRYATAGDFARDLEHWLEGRPVSVRAGTVGERTLRWARRRPALAAATVASAIAVIALAVGASQWVAKRDKEYLGRIYDYDAEINLAGWGLNSADAIVFERALERTTPKRGELDLRGIEWGLLNSLRATVWDPPWFVADGPIVSLASAGADGSLAVLLTNQFLLLTADGKVRRTWKFEDGEERAVIALNAGASRIAIGGRAGLDLFEIAKSSSTHVGLGKVSRIVFSPDGSAVAVVVDGETGESLQALEVESLKLQGSIAASPIALCWVSPRTLRFADYRGSVFEWGPGSGDSIRLAEGRRYTPSAQFSSDGTRIFRTSVYGVGHLWRIEDQDLGLQREGLPGDSATLAFAHDDRRLAVTTTNGAVQVIEMIPDPGFPPTRLLPSGHTKAITGMTFSPDGDALFTASRDGTLRRIPVHREPKEIGFEVEARLMTSAGIRPTFSQDGRWVALLNTRAFGGGQADELTQIWDLRERRLAGSLPTEIVAWHEGGVALSWDRDGRLQMWNLADPAIPRAIAEFQVNRDHHSDIDTQLAEGGRWIVSATKRNGVRAFEVSSGRDQQLAPTLTGDGVNVEFLAASPDTAFACIGFGNGRVALWDLRRNRVMWLPETSTEPPGDMRFSPGGRVLAVSDFGHRLRLFDGGTGQHPREMPEHFRTVVAMAFSPDGRRLITGGDDYTLIVWNVETSREVFRQRVDAPIAWICVSPDLNWMVTAHLPNRLDPATGSVGPSRYRLWPVTWGKSAPASRIEPTGRATVWERYRELAASHPP